MVDVSAEPCPEFREVTDKDYIDCVKRGKFVTNTRVDSEFSGIKNRLIYLKCAK